MIHFEWDVSKNRSNQRRHGVTFEEAQSAFLDDNAIEYDDPEDSADEDRFLLLGRSFLLRVLVVCHCVRGQGSRIRIISARKAVPRERRAYARRGKP